MPLPKNLSNLTGTYSGPSTLHLSWNPPGKREFTSDSTLSIELSAKSEYLTVHYTWVYEDEPQTGTMMITTNTEKNIAEVAWLDTWHMLFPMMMLRGTAKPLAVTGSYSVPDHPDWHWRIELITQEDNLALLMTNISPEGQEEWAVRAVYSRT
jgi:hypothetical protein